MTFNKTLFLEYLQEISEVEMENVTLDGYEDQLDAMMNKYGLDPENPDVLAVLKEMTHLSSSTLNTRKYVLAQLLAYNKIDIKDKDKKDKITRALKRKRPKPKRVLRPTDLLTWDEIVDVRDNQKSLSLKAFYMMLFDSGRRPGGIINLNYGDIIQTRYGYIMKFDRVKNEHGRRNVTCMIPNAIKTFENWFSSHPFRDKPDAPLFLNRDDERFLEKTLRNNLQKQHNDRLRRGPGKEKISIFPMLYRHSRATGLLREGKMSEHNIKMRMGHSPDSNVLMRYYAILEQEDLHKAELRYLGILPKEENVPQPLICSNCGAVNEKESTMCSRCHLPLSEAELQRQTEASVAQALQGLSLSSPLFQEIISKAVDQVSSEALKRFRLQVDGEVPES